MNKYKIDPESVNFLANRYPDMEITYIIDRGEESFKKNETKANAVNVRVNGVEYRVSYFMSTDFKKSYELTQSGMVIDKVLGKYTSLVSAVDSIQGGNK